MAKLDVHTQKTHFQSNKQLDQKKNQTNNQVISSLKQSKLRKYARVVHFTSNDYSIHSHNQQPDYTTK